MPAIRCDPEMAAWHERMQARGKAAKRAACAVAQKLLRRMMGKLRALRRDHPRTHLAAA